MLGKLMLAALMVAAMVVPASAAVIFIPMYFPPPTVPSARTTDYQNIHTVAVISALGHHLTMRNYHFIAPKSHEQDIQGWNLDDTVAAQLKQYLSPRFTFKDIPFDRAALANVPNGPWDGLSGKFSDFMKSLPKDGVDAFVVVRPDLEAGAPGIEGLALENGGAFGDMTPVVWANYELDIVDAHTGKTIASAYSRVQLRDKTPPSFVGMFVTDKLRVGDDFRLDDAQTQILRLDLSFLIHMSVVETLRSLNTGVALPSPGARTIVPIPSDKNPYRAYKSVAVVSGVADVLDLVHMGGTILSHDSYSVPEPGWQLDAMLEKRAQDTLRSHFEIKDVTVDRTAFAKARVSDEDGKLAPNFPGLAASPDIDLYLVFVKVPPHVIPRAAQVTGVGVFNKSAIGAVTRAAANYAAVVLDAHTMKVLAAQQAIASPARPDSTPIQLLDDSVWPSAPPVMTDLQARTIRDTLTDLLTDSEDETLLRMGLTGMTISDEAPSVAANLSP